MAKRRLPPLNGLRAFEAAARLGSFAAAAAELGVTAGAVSQRVRDLESRIGAALFERRPQSLVPSRAARELLPVLSEAFDAIAAALARIGAPAATARPIRLAAPAGFAVGWLLPRLERFARRAPEVVLVMTATERLIEPGDEAAGERIDAAIRFGRAGWSGALGCDFLFAGRRIPVCSPAHVASHPLAAGHDPLAGHTLLEALSAPGDWQDWALSTGMALAGTRRLAFGDERLTAEAAARGLGLALADRALVVDSLVAGRLVAPLEPLEMLRGTAWFLVYPEATAGEAGMAALRGWLLDECDGAEG